MNEKHKPKVLEITVTTIGEVCPTCLIFWEKLRTVSGIFSKLNGHFIRGHQRSVRGKNHVFVVFFAHNMSAECWPRLGGAPLRSNRRPASV